MDKKEVLASLNKIADALDKTKNYDLADSITDVMVKVSQYTGPGSTMQQQNKNDREKKYQEVINFAKKYLYEKGPVTNPTEKIRRMNDYVSSYYSSKSTMLTESQKKALSDQWDAIKDAYLNEIESPKGRADSLMAGETKEYATQDVDQQAQWMLKKMFDQSASGKTYSTLDRVDAERLQDNFNSSTANPVVKQRAKQIFNDRAIGYRLK
jgi:hypothetical protein